MTTEITDERLATHQAYFDAAFAVSRMEAKWRGQEVLAEAKRARSEETRLRAEVERLTGMVDSAIVYANCKLNFHSDSCVRETWRQMVAKLGAKELPHLEYEHPEAAS